MNKERDMLASAPSFGAILIWLWGVPIEKWAALAGLLFIVLQAAHRIWRWRNEASDRAKGKPTDTTDRADL